MLTSGPIPSIIVSAVRPASLTSPSCMGGGGGLGSDNTLSQTQSPALFAKI